MDYVLAMVISLITALITMPFLMKLANKLHFTDKPSKRKQHKVPTPLCGGLALYFGFFVSYFIFPRDDMKLLQQLTVFVAATMIIIIGLIDDWYKTKGKEFAIFPRLVIQLLSAILVFKAGVFFQGFTNPFTGSYVELNTTIQFILTITWIFGVTTVINWSDGMDGLAGGLSLISAITFFLAAIILEQSDSALVSIMLVGTILGFLYYNRFPAKVFMGDSGANFLGFILSITALEGAFKQATVLSLFIPILALAVPIFDNLFVIIKRFSEGKPVYQADRSQIHFRLEKRGLTTVQVVNYIMLISLSFSAISIILLLIKR
ncbi:MULTISPECIES: MraY family glycosyltransferase [Clostridium]|jgi:UDP-N-acetylmuramyl pentapeptide phosphotransferase/UDP-N-acetylglucosamine-1-phosphate transferase|uniref:Undecaprenyl-phosphate alpha-N-acetylglucosaminyl 1-phosphate transferase n=3 Tax=Clostridium TaxID=1485 RepID=A0AAV3VWI7_9CLOT|nr:MULTISPECIES: MraY family glycosyltransferase [Clostridium]ALB47315.1 undecaprenyl/decaprenyl-phosphate alpha-N-acetylglucosaminyl 1-phosphate transferase [Clostridium beijerinckii NRRL B-598]MBC2458994.1 undecaprenyl/decaprenyl-phosphate alpha-N-acetylglucosaminyl 1-phosphate transferase [Clostridium beijerinckii]MBC2475278.1 undecaprenyl/decaprenyl-phosphate alpha-N-acetylglucosaminyl 1-phosphate transferase [Clostridium beijerinckii]MCI1477495.1 undecaprenyl/decaprenyl-phosphate alpha-N-a